MMKRSTKESVQDVLASKEVYVSVSKTPAVTKFIWHVNPKDVEEEEDLKRKSPNARYLQGLSACLTVMVLWGIFWQVNNQLVPSIFSIGSASQAEPYRLAEMNYNAFQGDSSADLVSSVGGRRAASKLLLQVNAEEQIPSKLQQSDETTWGGSLAPVLHRNLRSHIDRASAN